MEVSCEYHDHRLYAVCLVQISPKAPEPEHHALVGLSLFMSLIILIIKKRRIA